MQYEIPRAYRKVAAEHADSASDRERELVAAAQAGSREAWSEIYRIHYSRVYRYVRARVFDEMTAEDLTAAVFVAAIESIHSYRYRGRPLMAWIYRLARNIVSSHQRKVMRQQRGNRRGPLKAAATIAQAVGSRAAPDETGAHDIFAANRDEGSDPADAVERMDLRDALSRLSRNHREVLILRFIVGLSTQEVADALGKNTGAVYSLVARALIALREELS